MVYHGAMESLEERLSRYLERPEYEPQDQSALARGLELASKERPALRSLLRDWEKSGKLLRLKNARYALRKTGADKPVTGRVRRLPSGRMIFVPVPGSEAQLRSLTGMEGALELTVRPGRTQGALDGDLVEAEVRLHLPQRWKKSRRGRPTLEETTPDLRVVRVVERKRTTWVGVYRPGGRFGWLAGDGRTSPETIELAEEPPGRLLAGQLAVAEVVEYPRGRMPARGRIVETLGWPEDEGVDMLGVIRKYGLRDEFPEEVIEEADRLDGIITPIERAKREDWTRRCIVTIDPSTARDFDDAIGVYPLAGGGWELAVHIADVSHYVRPGSALDAEARLRGNSTYLPDRVLPMLPPRLCDHLCSLREDEERLAKMCLMKVDAEGRVTEARFADTVIRSARRLSYEEAAEVMLRGGSCGREDVDTMLDEALKVARLMRRRRMAAGALDLEFPEVRLLLDDRGRTTGVQSERLDESHAVIEEFMLVANERVARALRERQIPALYRVHEEPDPSKLSELASQVRQYGLPAADLRRREDLLRVLELIKGHPDELLLKRMLLRSMMRARYDARPLGHYGLAKQDYCHFTSPIRRYADLIVHRAFSRLGGDVQRPPRLPDAAAMNDVAEHISETERTSAQAEQEATSMKLFEWLAEQCEASHPQEWEAVVADALSLGLLVELPDLQIKGLVPSSVLLGKSWRYESFVPRWSNASGQRLAAGARVRVVPIRVDRENRLLDLALVDVGEKTGKEDAATRPAGKGRGGKEAG